MATRYADPYRFDHGAQFFTARTGEFREFLAPLLAAEVVAPWCARFVEFDGDEVVARRQWDTEYPHYVGTPGMSTIGRHLAQGLDVRLNALVTRIERTGDKWELSIDGTPSEPFDWVIVTAPAAQARALLPETFAGADRLAGVTQLGCFALMLGFDAPPQLDWDAALIKGADISWISINSSKPGRADVFTLIVHATNRWADAHIEDDLDVVRGHMLSEVSRVTGINAQSADYCVVHRWRYANIDKQHGNAALVDTANRLVACGDWCVRGRVEAAFTSAMAAATALEKRKTA